MSVMPAVSVISDHSGIKYPPLAFIECTYECNHNCIHCFNYWRSDNTFHPEIHSADYYLSIAKQIAKNKPVQVVFTGGEPLIVFEKIKAAVMHLKDLGICVSFNTNAALVNDEIVHFLHENDISCFVSFPSCKKDEFDYIVDKKGAYERVLNSLHILQNHNVSFSCNIVVSRKNLNSIYDTAVFLRDVFGQKSIRITRVSKPLNATSRFDDNYRLSHDDFEKYISTCAKLKAEENIAVHAATVYTPCSMKDVDGFNTFAFENGCSAGVSSYIVSPDGNVRACARDEREYGNIITTDFKLIWKKMKEWRDGSLIPDKCKDCKAVRICKGGCRIDSLVKCNSYTDLDDYSNPNNRDFLTNPSYKMKADTKTYQMEMTSTVFVNSSISYVPECNCMRLSYKSSFIYCTNTFAAFLHSVSQFSVADFIKKYNVNFDTASFVLSTLYYKGMIDIR